MKSLLQYRGIYSSILSAIIALSLFSCGGDQKSKQAPGVKEKTEPVTYEQALKDWRTNKGIGPISEVKLGEIDAIMRDAGAKLFEVNCTACHEPYKDKIGPALVGLTERRTPEWIMNMMLNPEEMIKRDPICLGLLAKYNAVMANQRLSQDEARNILEYLRSLKLDDKSNL